MIYFESRKIGTLTQEFKHENVQPYHSSKSAHKITEEYNLSPSLIHKWFKQFDKTEHLKG